MTKRTVVETDVRLMLSVSTWFSCRFQKPTDATWVLAVHRKAKLHHNKIDP